jgi:hypothetical protein
MISPEYDMIQMLAVAGHGLKELVSTKNATSYRKFIINQKELNPFGALNQWIILTPSWRWGLFT